MKHLKTTLRTLICLAVFPSAFSQTDALPKVSHAEPLYLDLVRDLGARKGEKEFNIGADFRDFRTYREHAFFAEYEFAPVNRLGVEVEADFSFFDASANHPSPSNKLEALRLATQYSFFVWEEKKLTLAIGYTQIFEFTDFGNYGSGKLITGAEYNPFFIAAKRWGDHVHTLLFTYPLLEHDFSDGSLDFSWQINTSLLYNVPGSRHYVGLEVNQEITDGSVETTVHPQIKIKLDNHSALGLVTGCPVDRKGEGFSSFIRFIYEP